MAQHHLSNLRHNSGCARTSLNIILGHSTWVEAGYFNLHTDARPAALSHRKGSREKRNQEAGTQWKKWNKAIRLSEVKSYRNIVMADTDKP